MYICEGTRFSYVNIILWDVCCAFLVVWVPMVAMAMFVNTAPLVRVHVCV